MTRVTIQAADVTAWRGARASGDMMNGKGALVLTVMHHCVEPPEDLEPYKHPAPEDATVVEIVGTPAELEALRAKLEAALTAGSW